MLPDEDVPTLAGGEPGADGDPTGAQLPELDAADEEDRTVQAVAPDARASRPDVAPPTALEPTPPTAKAAPRPGPPRPGPPRPAERTPSSPAVVQNEPEEPDSITATAPRVSSPALPLGVPGEVQIRTLEEDLGDETKVRTLPGGLPGSLAEASPAPAPAPKPPSSPPDVAPADEPDDSVTTQAPAPRVASAPELGAIAISPRSLMPATALPEPIEPPSSVSGLVTRPGGDPPTTPRRASEPVPSDDPDAYDAEDSITTRGPAVDPVYEEDSVTTQAPAVSPELVSAATAAPAEFEPDVTEGTTKKVKRPDEPPSPADEEAESITTQAPGHLTNMLRVIAAESAPRPIDEDELPENRTAVMPGAPLQQRAGRSAAAAHAAQPAISPLAPTMRAGGAPHPASVNARVAAAPHLQPSSESGLRVARQTGGGERASLGVLGAHDARAGMNGAAGPSSRPDAAGSVRDPFAVREASPNDGELVRGPRYGLLVAVVAAISVLVPLVLFFVLNMPSDAVTPRIASQPSPDFVKRGDAARAKAARPAPPAPPPPRPAPRWHPRRR